jgi:hypothetical protein
MKSWLAEEISSSDNAVEFYAEGARFEFLRDTGHAEVLGSFSESVSVMPKLTPSKSFPIHQSHYFMLHSLATDTVVK